MIRLYFTLLLCGLLFSCDRDGLKVSKCSVPAHPKAEELTVIEVSENQQQCSYTVEANHRSKEVYDFYLEYFETNGWKNCQKSGFEWDNFTDQTNGSKEVYQNISYWENNEYQRVIVLALRHIKGQKGKQNVDVIDLNVGDDFKLESIGGKCP